MEPTLNQNWAENGEHDGGQSYGPGFTIAWQRGPLTEAGRNGAFLSEVLDACRHQLAYFEYNRHACQENADALGHLEQAIALLEARRARRAAAGTLGTTQVDTP